jgi:hypothetical protein
MQSTGNGGIFRQQRKAFSKMRKSGVIEQAFPVRSKAIVALRNTNKGTSQTEWSALVAECEGVACLYGRAPAARHWRVFAGAVEIIRLLTEWRATILAAGVDADRFLRAAKARLTELRKPSAESAYERAVLAALTVLDGTLELDAAQSIGAAIARIPMPISLYTDPEPKIPAWAQREGRALPEEKPELAVAFIEFTINGRTAEKVQSLTTREAHDLDIGVRVSRWPETADALTLKPISIEPIASFDLPTFRFLKPSGSAPFEFRQRGRMILHAPQSIGARPFEFIYAAEFEPATAERLLTIAGHRTLRLDGSGANGAFETGYPGIDRKLIMIRDQFRLEPHISQNDLSNLLIPLKAIGNLMGQCVQDALFPTAISESEFQERVKQFLRGRPDIGSELEEHPQAAGGATDLSFRGIRIELKSEKARRLSPDDCRQFAEQAATYAIGTNKRVAILGVLDCSPNKEVPFPIEDGIVIHPVQTATAGIYVVSCLFQGAIPIPSSFSKRYVRNAFPQRKVGR